MRRRNFLGTSGGATAATLLPALTQEQPTSETVQAQRRARQARAELRPHRNTTAVRELDDYLLSSRT